VLTCGAGYGGHGLGATFAQLVEESRARGALDRFLCPSPPADDRAGVQIRPAIDVHHLRRTPLRLRPGAVGAAVDVAFDRAAARALPRGVESGTAFTGQARSTLARARDLGAVRLLIVATSNHAAWVRHQQRLARARDPIERAWMTSLLERRMLAEYELADIVLVPSELTRQSFLVAGIPEAKLERIDLTVDPRFNRDVERTRSDHFEILYVGALTVAKGVAVLLDAIEAMRGHDVRLTLCGGWRTRAMRKHLEHRTAADDRINVVVGDPLPHLRRADVFVHPSFDDSFGYAPMEALAAGVPVIVTDVTGMHEHVTDGVDGSVIGAGDKDAIVERLLDRMRVA
jgi:glycosyltransferase involved in cell wall biosynthesis